MTLNFGLSGGPETTSKAYNATVSIHGTAGQWADSMQGLASVAALSSPWAEFGVALIASSTTLAAAFAAVWLTNRYQRQHHLRLEAFEKEKHFLSERREAYIALASAARQARYAYSKESEAVATFLRTEDEDDLEKTGLCEIATWEATADFVVLVEDAKLIATHSFLKKLDTLVKPNAAFLGFAYDSSSTEPTESRVRHLRQGYEAWHSLHSDLINLAREDLGLD